MENYEVNSENMNVYSNSEYRSDFNVHTDELKKLEVKVDINLKTIFADDPKDNAESSEINIANVGKQTNFTTNPTLSCITSEDSLTEIGFVLPDKQISQLNNVLVENISVNTLQDSIDSVTEEKKKVNNQENLTEEWIKNELEFPDEHAEKLMEQKEGQILCKLCPPGLQFDQQQFKKHLNDIHFQDKITIEDKWLCLPCFKPCQFLRPHQLHYHCPICRQPVCQKLAFIEHINEHKGSTKNLSNSKSSKELNIKETQSLKTKQRKKHLSDSKEIKEETDNSDIINVIHKLSETVTESLMNTTNNFKTVAYKIDRIRKYWATVKDLDISRIIQSLIYDVTTTESSTKHCLLCPEKVSFPSQELAEEHLYLVHAIHFVVIKDKWACLPCCKPCSPSSQDMHYHCPLCKQILSRQSCFVGHMRLQHQEDPSFLKDADRYVEGLIEEAVNTKGFSRTLEEVGRSPSLGFQIDSDICEKSNKENFDAYHYLRKYSIAPCFIKLQKLEKDQILQDPSCNLSSPLEFSDNVDDKFENEFPFEEMIKVSDNNLCCQYCDFQTAIQKKLDIQEHLLLEHWEDKVIVHDIYNVFPCMKICGTLSTTHYHCPICKLTVYGDQESFHKHVQRHPNPLNFKEDVNNQYFEQSGNELEEKCNSSVSVECMQENELKENVAFIDSSKITGITTEIIHSNQTSKIEKNDMSTEMNTPLTIPESTVNSEQKVVKNIKDLTQSNIRDMQKNQERLSVIKLKDIKETSASLFSICVEMTSHEYRCLLCLFSVDIQNKHVILNHLETCHQEEVAVVDQKWICLPFLSESHKEEAYHCPICGELVIKKNAFLLHTISHGVTISFDVLTMSENSLQQQFPVTDTREYPMPTHSSTVNKLVCSPKVSDSDEFFCEIHKCSEKYRVHYHCSDCTELFFKRQLYVRHKQNHKNSCIAKPEAFVPRKSTRLEMSNANVHENIMKQEYTSTSDSLTSSATHKRSKRESPVNHMNDKSFKSVNSHAESSETTAVYRLKREQIMKLVIRSGKQFSCALCAEGGYTFKRPDPVVQHLVNVHVKKGVMAHNRLVVPCLKNCYVEFMKRKNEKWCGERIHYHCITCKLVVSGKSKFLEHALSHSDDINKNNFTITKNNGIGDSECVILSFIFEIDRSTSIFLSVEKEECSHFSLKCSRNTSSYCEHPNCQLFADNKISASTESVLDVECCHMKNVSSAIKGESLTLEDKYLTVLNAPKYITEECLRLKADCSENNIPLIVLCNIHDKFNLLYFSVYNRTNKSWCRLQRVVVTKQNNGEIRCKCCSEDCIHTYIVKWYSLQSANIGDSTQTS